jgi:Tol biopolymer transport system component/tetratricopeptide (TPR) repeat protein
MKVLKRPGITSRIRFGGVLFLAACFSANCAGKSLRDDAKFSYQNIYEDRYQRGNGGIIPITIERGESYSGSVTNDQKYLYFSSNSSGNYDIYLRDLADVFSVPVVSAVTNQKEPSISPDGKYLVYVDDELDPDGDIVLLKVNPKKLIELYRERKQPGEEWFAATAKNLTNSEKNRIRARDANPTWSPDGKYIAWSSDLDPAKADDLGAGAGALQNIWIMPASDPEQKRQVTKRGGVMPAFSPDGKRIVYISYEDANSLGAVYEVELESGKTRRLTSGHALDFYPSYAPDGNSIILTRIAADSNGDGQIDRKDAGQIIRIYPESGGFVAADQHDAEDLELTTVDDDEYVPLTSPSDHVFDSRVSNFIGGSVVLAQLKGEDVNVAFIPLSGAIPVKPDIRQQQQYLLGLQQRGKEQARLCMALEQLPAAFASSPDVVVYDAISAMRRARCDAQAKKDLQAFFATSDTSEIALYRLLNDLSAFDPEYADLRGIASLEPLADTSNPAEYFAAILRQKKIWSYYRDDDADDYRAVLTFVRHAEARHYIRQGRYKVAREVINRILRENSAYLAIDELLYDIGVLDSPTLPAREFIYLVANEPDVSVLKGYSIPPKAGAITIRPHIRRKAEKFLLDFFEKQFDAGNKEAQEQFLESFPVKKHRTLHALFALAAARDSAENDLYDEAASHAARVQQLTEPGSLFQYHAAIVLAGIAELKQGADAAIALYKQAITTYRDSEVPENVGEIISKIGNFYHDRAEQLRVAGDDRGATKQYEALLDLYLSAHANRLTKELSSRDLLDYTLNLDQIALRAATKDEDLLEDILSFYDSRIDLARRFLVTEFIFGRGFLRSQLGIQRHLAAEAEGLSRSAKKEVFEHFRKAEIDLNWCFFADSRFADAYIMLGWMYQFIDEKREIVLDISSGKRDREIFESLYKSYFPDYLFEKNIRLYQKTLSLFGKSASPRIRNSFHLNIANNYYLLNNYNQAEEHYTAILDSKGNPDYQFESPEQEMMYYYHLGRTLYFTGKYDAAARYLRYVENNLNARYPINGVNAQTQQLNQSRREIAYKTFALNSEYAQNLQAAINYLQTIVAERKLVGAQTPGSMIHLDLARLYLRSGDLSSSLEQTQKAEELLAKEKEIPIPKYKIRIKWFWVYEPWTWLVGLIYKLPYDDIIIGDNHLAFELPTVNRYQLLYSIRADIYRSKGLLQEASGSLAKLVEYAEKDKTKHGRETLSNAASRRAELEFSLRSWDSARKLYETALEQAEKNKNAGTALMFRKNIELCRLRKLETHLEPIADKIKAARRYAQEIAEFEEDAVSERVKISRKALKEKDDPTKPDLTEQDIAKIRERTQSELQPVILFRGLYLAHLAELEDFSGRIRDVQETFDSYLARKQVTFTGYTSAMKYFRGFTTEGFSEVHPAFEPDLKNNSLRIKLAMNRAKILQEMSLFDESVAEFKAIQERSQEFRAQLEYAIAAYRLYRVYEDAGLEDRLSTAPYAELVRYFVEHPAFLKPNTDLFERLSNLLIDRAVRQRAYAEAMRLEDMKRQAIALPLYFDDLKLYGSKEETFGRLLTVEQTRHVLSERIRVARLQRQSPQQLEKELLAFDAEAKKLRSRLIEPDRLDYRYETLFSTGYSDAELLPLARHGFIYVLKPRDELLLVYARAEAAKKGLRWFYDTREISGEKPAAEQLKEFAKKNRAAIIVLSPYLLTEVQADAELVQLALQTSLRAAINFARNPELARRNVMQTVKVASFFSIGSKNEVDYQGVAALQRVRNAKEAAAAGIHSNVVDYEAELARKAIVIDNALLTPAALFALRSNPNYAIVSFQARDALQKADEFRFAAAADLYFSAMGAGQVLHTLTTRARAKENIELFLNKGTVAAGTLLTGNAQLPGYGEKDRNAGQQKTSYLKKIAQARKQREYAEAASYAEDAISLFPKDASLRLLAAELYHIQGETEAASRQLSLVEVDARAPLTEKLSYFRIMLRTRGDAGAREFLTAHLDVQRAVRKEPAEYQALRQLYAYSTGDVELLKNPAPWEESYSPRQMPRAIDERIRNAELRNEICVAATASLEFVLVINSCLRNANADPLENSDRALIQSWFSGGKSDLKAVVRNEDLEFNHAVSLLQSGYVADALPYVKKTLGQLNLSVSENLLAFSLLRVLAQRKVKDAESRAAAAMLSEFAEKAVTRTKNLQAKAFYGLLSGTEKVFRSGAAALGLPAKNSEATGVISARNHLLLMGMSVAPAAEALPEVTTSSFTSDRGVEKDLRFLREAIESGSGEADCSRDNCSLLIKYYLRQKQNMPAADLVLRQHGAGRPWEKLQDLPAGTYGYTELFTGEFYEWYFSGKEFTFERLDDFNEKIVARPRSGRKYLAWTPQKNLFLRLKISPPRESILVSAGQVDNTVPAAPKGVRIEAPQPATLYSALYAKWGEGKKRNGEAVIQVKAPYDSAAGTLNVYSEPVKLQDTVQLKPSGYHLFCEEGEGYNGFAVFAQNMVENMIQRKMSPEAAYEAAGKALKGRQAVNRPRYYLYRN